jgi:hypothetical protein
MNSWLFVVSTRIFLLGILSFKGLTARRLYKSFGVKGLIITAMRVANHNGCSSLKTHRNVIKFAVKHFNISIPDHAPSVLSSAALWLIKIVSSGRFKRKLQRIQTTAHSKHYLLSSTY